MVYLAVVVHFELLLALVGRIAWESPFQVSLPLEVWRRGKEGEDEDLDDGDEV